MLTKELYRLKSKTPSKNAHQEWWTFLHPAGDVEVVLRNWRSGKPIVIGNDFFIEKLKIEGLLDSPCTIDNEFLKEYYVELEKAQTKLIKRRPLES